MIGDTFHNFVDGSLIAAAFMESTELGIVTALAIIAHEIPQEVGDYLIQLHSGYSRFKAERNAQELATIAARHGLDPAALQSFVDSTLDRMIFDGDKLSDLYAPYDLGWKDRTQKETALMQDCAPYLVKRAGGRDISGLSAYE